MAVVKFNLKGQDANKNRGKPFTPLKPGIYRAKVTQFSVTKPRGKDRRIEAVVEVYHKDYPGKPPLFDYINLESEAAAFKLDQVLQALNVANSSKRTGTFDPDKQKGKFVKVQVRLEADDRDGHEGEMRPKIASWINDKDVDIDDEVEDSDDEDAEEDESEEEEDTEEEEDAEEEDDSEEEEEDDSEEEEDEDNGIQYDEFSIQDLKDECKARGLSVKGKRAELIARLQEDDGENPFDE